MTPVTDPQAFEQRRRRLAVALEERDVIQAAWTGGWARPRNFAHNVYPFRAESHFLYLTGLNLEGAVLVFAGAEFQLFVTEQETDHAIWEGRQESAEELSDRLGLAVRPVSHLPSLPDAALLPPQDDETARWLSGLLDRPCDAQSGPDLVLGDAALADAMIAIRLEHDEAARTQLSAVAQLSGEAHREVMSSAQSARTEGAVRGRFIAHLSGNGLGVAYDPIVTKTGEVLHARGGNARLAASDLVLCDVGGETPEGWAADITRTWPSSGRFTKTQRTLYDVVLGIQKAVIKRVAPGTEYAELHDFSQRLMAQALLSLGIIRGELEEVLAHHVQAVFFPHGVGHLLGLDVHDMEDLGDRAGYAPGRQREDSPARHALRLDRTLRPNMLVTIEPGFYQIPQLIERARADAQLSQFIDFGELRHYEDVRGIRIEDDVLVTESGAQVLSAAAPKEATELEELISEA